MFFGGLQFKPIYCQGHLRISLTGCVLGRLRPDLVCTGHRRVRVSGVPAQITEYYGVRTDEISGAAF